MLNCTVLLLNFDNFCPNNQSLSQMYSSLGCALLKLEGILLALDFLKIAISIIFWMYHELLLLLKPPQVAVVSVIYNKSMVS